ncbi:DNA polymerase-4 [Breznakia sp. PF5-3]|uniref:DNA polymerase IV n=1 Tax=unclassified Breznakia TaxID=2623764 RepID=UPI002404C384|nr:MULTISPECIES: DNA polymerase IV [unclassified Breznakia]MDF9823915.1 DNA polymerase-4 [Breznakia sp. PM6-1]MDF9834714.1 DNA polymerase-4 [Breznakia sp. PF5-3]MDF9836851.1 DNA polymerase-4 [Breznakia sp. PFB2-8]MDF9858868.1 DNA polymerase-4 [Breznakia sp. PH5-24]
MAKVIFHIDLNAYYASAEVLRNSALEGQPVVVGGLSKRSVVCTASYEARAYGVHAAMPLHEAYKKCPDLVVVEGDHEYYRMLSKKFFAFIKTYSPFVEVASIDECYVDMSEVIKNYKRPLDLAWEIQQKLRSELKLKCSIGIAPTKFLAKMASDRYKPMGIYIIRKQEVSNKLWNLPIRDMLGIGKKTAPLLVKNGIETIGDLLKEENQGVVHQYLGKQAYQVLQQIQGNSSDEINFSHTVQSISQSTTINHDVEDYTEITQILRRLAQSLAERAKTKSISGKLISLSIRYFDFRNVVRSINLEGYTNDSDKLYENAISLFDEHAEELPIRHLGIGLGSLQSDKERIDQLSLFQTSKPSSNNVDVLEELNKEIVGKPLVYASSLLDKDGK